VTNSEPGEAYPSKAKTVNNWRAEHGGGGVASVATNTKGLFTA